MPTVGVACDAGQLYQHNGNAGIGRLCHLAVPCAMRSGKNALPRLGWRQWAACHGRGAPPPPRSYQALVRVWQYHKLDTISRLPDSNTTDIM